jgi:hypothetical protein
MLKGNFENLVTYSYYENNLLLLLQPFRVGALSYIFKNGCHPVDHLRNPFSIAVSRTCF